MWIVKDKFRNEIKEGDEIIDFRGEKSTFRMISRPPIPGKSAKILDGRGCEVYCTVYDLTVEEI